MFELPIELVTVFLIVSMIVALLAALWILSSFYIKVSPNKVAIISGRRHELADGTIAGYRLITGGATLVTPFFEKVEYLDLNITPIPFFIGEAYTVDDVPVSIKAIANIKIKSDSKSIRSAAERFLGMPETEFHQIVSQAIEGHLRTVLRAFTIVDIHNDRQIIAQELLTIANSDLEKMGVELNAFTIKEITDEERLEKN